jgi:hypothetical protein
VGRTSSIWRLIAPQPARISAIVASLWAGRRFVRLWARRRQRCTFWQIWLEPLGLS